MTAKERDKFNKQLDKIAWDARMKAKEICDLISLPLEIQALERIDADIKFLIETNKNRLNKIKSQTANEQDT